MSESTGDSKVNRFNTVTTVLIALVSTVIALVAAQSAVASGNATEAQHDGVLAKINLERVDGATRAQIAREQRAFDDYRTNRDLYTVTFDYVSQAEAGGNNALGTRLRLEAAAALEDSNNAYRFLDSRYLLKDESDEFTGIDTENYLNDRRQSAAIFEDIDYTDNLAEATEFRQQSLSLGISLLVWFIALLFLTWAEITKSALRWVWLVAGILLSLGILAAYLFSGLARLVSLG
jgi:hypothetical protein